jgi:hypothetical protein
VDIGVVEFERNPSIIRVVGLVGSSPEAESEPVLLNTISTFASGVLKIQSFLKFHDPNKMQVLIFQIMGTV